MTWSPAWGQDPSGEAGDEREDGGFLPLEGFPLNPHQNHGWATAGGRTARVFVSLAFSRETGNCSHHVRFSGCQNAVCLSACRKPACPLLSVTSKRPATCSGCSFLFAREDCKKRDPKPLPSLPDIPQPGPHPMGVPCGGGPVIPLTGGSEHSQILVPQYSMTGTQCLLGPGLTNVGEGNAKQGKGMPIQRASSRRHPHGSTRHGHIHRAHGGACQSTRGCDLCTPTWSRWEDLSPLATCRHACTRVCTCRQRGQHWLCLCALG